jgi:hypothetical protein
MKYFSKGILVLGLSIFIGIGALTAVATAQHDDHKDHSGMKMGDADGQITIQGEVLDLYCFMKHPDNGQGAGHAKCAQTCIRKGLPIGFLSDGEVYLIIGKEHESAKDIVVDFAGSQSVLTGTLVTHHGVKAIEVVSIEKVD